MNFQDLVKWVRQPTTVAGLSALAGTLTALDMHTLSLQAAVPLLVGGLVGLVIPDNTHVADKAVALATDAMKVTCNKQPNPAAMQAFLASLITDAAEVAAAVETPKGSEVIRLEAIEAAAAAYDPLPAIGVQRIAYRDVTADVFAVPSGYGVAVRGSDNFGNWERDGDVETCACADHPRLGPCFRGAIEAAEGLLPLVQAIVGRAGVYFVGHSLGGQIAVDLAAMAVDAGWTVLGVWGFDPPKSGYQDMVAVLAKSPVEILRFDGSIVSHWPFDRGAHVRPPVEIGDYTPDLATAHSITRAVAWVVAHP